MGVSIMRPLGLGVVLVVLVTAGTGLPAGIGAEPSSAPGKAPSAGAPLGESSPPAAGADSRALRRTLPVQVFEQWQGSVVFVTGPVVKPGKPTVEEFFRPAAGAREESGVGTGIIIHESGYVVANAHGVERLIQPHVALAGKGSLVAEVVAVEHQQDLALLKIAPDRPLTPVRLARSGDVMVGETVIVIANPHGLLRTCTVGVVSAVGRSSTVDDIPGLTLFDLIQSDAAINPGSSGGPWLNVAGEVMGITSSMKRGSENIAFAVSAASLRSALVRMLDVERRFGLVTGMTIAPDGPCRVVALEPKLPAAEAGVREGDVIEKLGDRPTPTSLDYHLALVDRKPGEALRVEVLREGRRKRGTITLGQRPKPDGAALLRKLLGLTAGPLSAEEAKAMGLRLPQGVLVMAVDTARYEKLPVKPQPGDVLARIGRMRPRDLDHVGLLLEKVIGGQPVAIVLLRKQDNLNTRIDANIVVPP
jgi:serine protease Do